MPLLQSERNMESILSLKNFIERNIEAVNKRALENFIKAGALDCLEGNRHQKMIVFGQIVDDISRNKKQSMAGQLSLFDIASEEDKKEFEIRMPNVEEYDKETILAYEKEVLGIYLSRVSSGALPQYDGENDLRQNHRFPADRRG